MHQPNKIALLIPLLLSSISGWATDNIPLDAVNIEADKALIDEIKSKSTYTGNVVLKQNKMKINAEQIEFIGNKGKFDKLIAYGDPVIFHQQGQDQKSTLFGKAKKIEYLANSKIVTFFGEAELYQGDNQFSGDRIEYNIKSGIVTASKSEQGKQRVRVTLQPHTAEKPTIEPSQD
jgi:lipopolysaccharide export system protein LptA